MRSKKKFQHIYDLHTKNYNGISADDRRKWFLAEYLDTEYGFEIQNIITDADTLRSNWKEYVESLREQVPENFCLYPFTNFQLDPDGRARPCCKYKVGDSSWQQDVPKIPDCSIEDLWEQDEFKTLREQFLKNERPAGCKACWDEEDAGIKSMRLQKENAGKEHPYSTFFDHIPRAFPRTLDLKFSNLCNLKCRICTPFLSSQWLSEVKALKTIDNFTYDLYSKNSKEKFSSNPKNIEILKEWAPTIDLLEFYGGEPLMQQEHNDVLEIIYQHGNPQHTGLYYNTNGTIFNEKFFELWSRFQTVTINFSIDDINDRFEYQRKNANWDQICHNIQLYKEYGEKYKVNLKLRIYSTVGILNVFYLPEFFEEMKKFGIEIYLNLVHYPHHYAIHILPTEIKDIIKAKLLTVDESIISNESPRIDNIINFMYNIKPNKDLLDKFFKTTTVHDDYRNESFSTIFPDLFNLIKDYR